MTDVVAIPGADALVGRGVYHGLPKTTPQPVRDRNAVVVGEAVECAAASRQLGAAGWRVTLVTRERSCGCGVRRGCRRMVGREVVCAAGGEYLEAVVLRRIDDGRIDACNASALFIL
jgi:ribulose 1,5-bisphosphate synthetase/thiazole synthase